MITIQLNFSPGHFKVWSGNTFEKLHELGSDLPTTLRIGDIIMGIFRNGKSYSVDIAQITKLPNEEESSVCYGVKLHRFHLDETKGFFNGENTRLVAAWIHNPKNNFKLLWRK